MNIAAKILVRVRLLSGTSPKNRGSVTRIFGSVSRLKSIDAIVKAAVAIEMMIDTYWKYDGCAAKSSTYIWRNAAGPAWQNTSVAFV